MRHAPNWNGNDVTLCGLALEAGDDRAVTGETENPQIAGSDQTVTCVECRCVIDHVFRVFYRFRRPPHYYVVIGSMKLD